jgi:hypothetical protein
MISRVLLRDIDRIVLAPANYIRENFGKSPAWIIKNKRFVADFRSDVSQGRLDRVRTLWNNPHNGASDMWSTQVFSLAKS